MIIYNVTTHIATHVSAEWLQWLLEEHAPEIVATHCFTDYKVVKLLDVDESEGPTYAVQYLAESMADYQRYINEHADEMRKRATDKWGDRFISFRTIMQVVK
jgi:hypothetical protein